MITDIILQFLHLRGTAHMAINQKTSEVEKIFQELQEQILNGSLPTGYRLIESQIASTFGVSRTPARLAIERLASIGLAEHSPNRGAVVHQPSYEELRDLLHIRQVNEGLTARMAAEKCRPEDAKALREIVEQMEQALASDDVSAYSALSSQLHARIMATARNRFLTDYVMRIYMITSRFQIAITSLPSRAEHSLEEHRAIATAIINHDGDTACQTMMKHIEIIKRFFDDEHTRIFFQFRSNPAPVSLQKHSF